MKKESPSIAVLLFLGVVLTWVLLLVGCGQDQMGFSSGSPKPPFDFVPRARAEFQVSVGPDRQVRFANPTSVPVSYVYVANATMTVNTSGIVAALSGDTLDLGEATITNLRDNNLKVCGVHEDTKCTTALILIYTSGTAAAGMYNSTDGYGVPIVAGLSTLATVGLARANAAVVQTQAIPGNKNQFRDSDFSTTPTYQIESDFSNAGAGSYSTTLVIEYGLSL